MSIAKTKIEILEHPIGDAFIATDSHLVQLRALARSHDKLLALVKELGPFIDAIPCWADAENCGKCELVARYQSAIAEAEGETK